VNNNVVLTNGAETFLLGSVIEDERGPVHAQDCAGKGYTRCDDAECISENQKQLLSVWHDDETSETFWAVYLSQSPAEGEAVNMTTEETETDAMSITITGMEAIDFAERRDMTLRKYTDPIEGDRAGLTPDEARKVAREDPSLIYLKLRCVGWTVGDGTGHEGYSAADYFPGCYLGADAHGIEPVMAEAI
jgi:hypothetical protein